MWFRPSNMLKVIVALCVAVQSADALTIDEREALNVEIAAMDFMDPTVSVLEMKDKLMMRMPVPETVMNDQVRAYKAKDENIYRTLKDGRYEQMIFRNMELREREILKLKEFQEWLVSKKLKMPKGFEDGVEIVRVLSNR